MIANPETFGWNLIGSSLGFGFKSDRIIMLKRTLFSGIRGLFYDPPRMFFDHFSSGTRWLADAGSWQT